MMENGALNAWYWQLKTEVLYAISGFHREVDEKFVLLVYYAASSGNTFRRFGTT
jgi:hypothetical protein